MRRSLLLAFLVVSASLVCIQPADAEPGDSPCENATETTVVEKASKFGTHVEYTFQFSKQSNTYCVEVVNKGDTKSLSDFGAEVDGKAVSRNMPTLEPGESIYVTKNITGYLDVRRDNHTVELGAYQKSVTYNFTQRSTSENSTIPSPVISDVEVVRDENNGTAALRVSTFNPAKRGYAFYIQVETFETNGAYTVAAPQENETSTVLIPLDESAEDVVAGKVRIFDEPSQPETKFDQKEFMAKPGNVTNYWDVEFKQVPDSAETYSYQNETARAEYRGWDENLLTPVQKQVGAVATVVLLIGVMWWRRTPS